MKKILFILHVPPPVHGSSVMGKFIVTSDIVNSEFKTNHINLGTSSKIDEIGKGSFRKIVLYCQILIAVVNQLLFNKPDIVYLAITAKGVAFYKDFIVVLLTKIFRIKLVLHFHNKGVCLNQNKIIDNILYRILFNNTKVILLSQFLLYDIKKYVISKNVYYCPNGIPKMNSIIKSKSNNNKITNILFLSNLIESKGVFILLEACSMLKKRGVEFNCTFVGGEGDINKNDFQEKLKCLNLKDLVSYEGKKYGDEKEKYFLNADIFVLPTLNDTFGLVILEAMQYSLPVIATIEGGIPDIVLDNQTGYLVEKNNALSLADKLELLIGDANLRLKMGRKGFQIFEKKFTIESFEKNFVGILKNIITS